MGNAIRAYTKGYVENAKDRLEYIVDFMYDNFDSLNERKTCELLCDIFIAEGFDVKKDVAGVQNSFKASFGNGGKTIAYICDYDTKPSSSNICSHNFTAAMNAGSALGLKRAITELGDGRVVVFGCPKNAKTMMLRQGEFDGVDAVIYGHASSKTYESGTSLGCSNIEFTYQNKKTSSRQQMLSTSDSQNPVSLLLNLIELFKASYPGKVIINGVIDNIINCDSPVPEETKCTLSIKSYDKNFIEFTKTKLIDSAKFCAKFYESHLKYELGAINYIPLKTHSELSKIASHNLKECGIINIHAPITLNDGIELGSISAVVPTINPGIGICKKDVAALTTNDFNKSAKSTYAKQNMVKAACALALTGVDIIQSPEILKVVNIEPYIAMNS